MVIYLKTLIFLQEDFFCFTNANVVENIEKKR